MKGQEHEPTREELLRAFGETPPAFKAGIDATLRSLTQGKEERIVKRKLTFAPVLVLALLLLLAGVAMAAVLYPKTVERYSEIYGEDFGARLAQGDIAQSGASCTLGDVTYTVTDVIYEGGVLYGTVVMEPAAGVNAVLIPEDADVNDPAGYNIHYGEEAPEGAKSYGELAQERGARIVLAKCVADGYLIDGESLSGDVGYVDTVTTEGTIISSFELYGWNGAIERADSYTLRMDAVNWEVTLEGEWLLEESPYGSNRKAWDVTVTPAVQEREPQATAEPLNMDGVRVIVPEGYDGTLPAYAVEAVNYMDVMRPEMITDAAVVHEERSEYGANYLFEGDDQMVIDEGNIAFYAYDGTEEIAYEDAESGILHTQTVPHEELPEYLSALASWENFNSDKGQAYMEADTVQDLAAISLADAKNMLEALFDGLGIEHEKLVYVYAMDMERAKALSDAWNKKIETGEILNSNPYDISGMTEQDEGYLLVYRACVDGVPVDDQYMSVQAFVTAGGIRSLTLRAPFALSGALGEAQTLIPAEEAFAEAVSAAKKSWDSYLAPYIEQAYSIELIYTVRDRAKLVPAWQILALEGEGEDAWPIAVIVSALDGTVLNAPWM